MPSSLDPHHLTYQSDRGTEPFQLYMCYVLQTSPNGEGALGPDRKSNRSCACIVLTWGSETARGDVRHYPKLVLLLKPPVRWRVYSHLSRLGADTRVDKGIRSWTHRSRELHYTWDPEALNANTMRWMSFKVMRAKECGFEPLKTWHCQSR